MVTVKLPPEEAQQFAEENAQFIANQIAIEENLLELLSCHAGEWVGSHAGEFVFGESIEDVVATAEAHGWPVGLLAVRPVRHREPTIL